MKREELQIVADVLEHIAIRFDGIGEQLRQLNANLEITNRTIRDVSQVTALVHDMVRALHDRQIELADDHGGRLRQLEARGNGRG